MQTRADIRAMLVGWGMPVAAFVIVTSTILLWPKHAPPKTAVPVYNNNDSDYLRRLEAASAVSDPNFSVSYKISKEIQLKIPIRLLSSLTMDARHIVVIDGLTPGVMLLDTQGSLIRRLGSPGKDPGSYISPADATTTDQSVAVVDFSQKRVTFFKYDGSLKGTIVYGPQLFSAQSIVRTRLSPGYLLFGNRWARAGGPSSTLLFHSYDESGQFRGSFMELPDFAQKLDLAEYDQPVFDRAIGSPREYFMFPWSSSLYRITFDNKVVETKLQGLTSFRLPTTKPPGGEDIRDFHKWQYTWTPIVGLSVSDAHVTVETRCLCPSLYKLYSLDRPTGRLESVVGTNLLLEGTAPHNQLLFVRDDIHAGEHTYAAVIVAPTHTKER